MICPRCRIQLKCPCPACRPRNWARPGLYWIDLRPDAEKCPLCGLSAHRWMDWEWDQHVANEAVAELEAFMSGDTEICHSEADGILCKLLIRLGCRKVIDAYEKVPKWYA